MGREDDIHDMPAPTDYQPLFPGQVMPGHIKVELDFIPVEERLPVEEVDTSGLYAVLRGSGDLDILWFHNCGDDGSCWETQVFEETIDDITHWSEIPQVSDDS